MEVVILVIMLLVCFSFLLKLTCQPLPGRLVVAVLVAIFVGLTWEYAVSQSRAQIADWIQNPELMLDMAVILTVDVAMQIAFCVLSAKLMAGERLSKCLHLIRALLLWIPGLLVFPTLFATLVEIIFSFPGYDFATLAWSTAAGVLILSAGLPFLVKWLIPEYDLRLELIFMLNALIALLGVIATVNGRTAVNGTNSVEWIALVAVVAILAIGAAIGLLLYRRKINKLIIK